MFNRYRDDQIKIIPCMKLKIGYIIFLIFVSASCLGKSINDIVSLNGRLVCSIENVNDSLFFYIKADGNDIIQHSPILFDFEGHNIGWNIIDVNKGIWKDTVNMIVGENRCSIATANQRIFTLKGKLNNDKIVNAKLFFRVFDGIVAYRLILNLPKNGVINEKTRIVQSSRLCNYFMSNGEHEPLGNLSIDELDRKKNITPVFWTNGNYLICLHEACLYNYPCMRVSFDKKSNFLELATGKTIVGTDVELPWRFFSIGKNWQELHNLKHLSYNLNLPSEGNFDWVKPGISMWDWRVRGCAFDGFTYGLNTESIKRFIDFSSQNGISYCLIDDGWYEKDNPLQPIEDIDINEIVCYGKRKGVDLLLYYDLKYMDITKNELDFNIIAQKYSSLGVKGIKYGFLGSKGTKYTPQEKVKKTLDIIKIAAQNKLIVNFHDSPIPFSGLERTYPNYISREFCHAQMDRRRAFTPGAFVKMACVNLYAGAMDQSNGVYELYKIKERSKGPVNEFNSTISSENARFFITHTGHLSVLIDAPEAYKYKNEMFEFIRNLPQSWDETKYIDMDFNSHVCVARRSGDVWYVGTVYNEEGGKHNLTLDFLDKDCTYEMILFKDKNDSHYIDNKEAYEIKKEMVDYKSSFIINVVPGGGYSAIIRKRK